MFYAIHHKSDLGCYGTVASVSSFRQGEKEIAVLVVRRGLSGLLFIFWKKYFSGIYVAGLGDFVQMGVLYIRCNRCFLGF